MRMYPLLLSTAALFYAQDNPKPKPFNPPDFLVTNPLIAKDEGCAKDLAKTVNLEGLEKRKQLADLFTYGCVQWAEGLYRTNILAFSKYGEGAKAVSMRKVYLIESATAQEKTGWILANQLEIFSDAIIKAVIKSLPDKAK